MDKERLLSALRDIGLALNVTHNTVTTDVVGVEPTDTSWRVDHSRELALLGEIEKAIAADKIRTEEQFNPMFLPGVREAYAEVERLQASEAALSHRIPAEMRSLENRYQLSPLSKATLRLVGLIIEGRFPQESADPRGPLSKPKTPDEHGESSAQDRTETT